MEFPRRPAADKVVSAMRMLFPGLSDDGLLIAVMTHHRFERGLMAVVRVTKR